MKLYRSLVFREMKLSRRYSILSMILFALLEVFLILPLCLPDDEPSTAEEIYIYAAVMALIAAAIGGFISGMNNGVNKADIASGWKRYTYVLPATSKQKAAADLIAKLLSVARIGLLLAAFTVCVMLIRNVFVLKNALSVFFFVAAVSLLFDTVYCGILMIAKSEKDIKKYTVIASATGLLLLRFFSRLEFGLTQKMAGKTGEEVMRRLADVSGSGVMTVTAAAAFATVSLLYFVVMWRSYERREE